MSLFGIYNSQRSLQLNQSVLNVINNNIANLNTDGYSKQRVELSQITLDSSSAAETGGGAQIDAITRNRDSYIDSYYRNENTKFSYYDSLKEYSTYVENVTNELSGTGLTTTLNNFYTAANNLSNNPTSESIRSAYKDAAISAASQFNQTANQLTNLRTNLVGDGTNQSSLDGSQIKSSVGELNDNLQKLADINKTIALATASGTTPNSLMDERDKLLDSISGYLPVSITQGGNNQVTVTFNGMDLVKGAEIEGQFSVGIGNASNPAVVSFTKTDGTTVPTNITSGSIGAILSLGGSGSGLTIKGVLDNLDQAARGFAAQVNGIQTYSNYDSSTGKTTAALAMDSTGKTLVDPSPASNHEIFLNQSDETTADDSKITAANIQVNQSIISNVFNIAAARITYTGTTPAATDLTSTGDGSNALLMYKSKDSTIDPSTVLIGTQTAASLGISGISNQSVTGFLSAKSTDVGSQVSVINNSYSSQSSVMDQITSKREAVSGVDLDEELTDLVKYQRAYEASARVLNTVNSLLNTLMNIGA